jgi:hypothetical protein
MGGTEYEAACRYGSSRLGRDPGDPLGCTSFGEVDPAHSQLGPLLIEAGEPLTYIQQQPGHHSPGFTLTVYGTCFLGAIAGR